MLSRRSTRNLITLPLSVAALAVSASSLLAQGRPLFDWSGRVDREVRITMRGRDARTQTTGRTPFERSRLNVETALPERDGYVTVRVQDGRGDADVIQQPSARNDFTTVVRVRDRSSGVDNYRLTATTAMIATTVAGVVVTTAATATAATAMVATAMVATAAATPTVRARCSGAATSTMRSRFGSRAIASTTGAISVSDMP